MKVPTALARWLAALTALTVALVPLAQAHDGSTRGAAVKSVTVTIKDTSVLLSAKTVPAGSVMFAVKNLSTKPHKFSIGGKTTSVIAAGKSGTLTVSLNKAGSFTYTVLLNGGRTGKLTVTGTTTSTGASGLAAGKKVFVSSSCGKCHILKAAGSTGTIGTNLDQAKPSKAKVIAQVTSGGGFMPSFGGSLTKAQIDAVAAYVYASTH